MGLWLGGRLVRRNNCCSTSINCEWKTAMEVIYQSTKKFEKDIKTLGEAEKTKVIRKINTLSDIYLTDKDTFFKSHQVKKLILTEQMISSLYSMRIDHRLRLLFSIDEDPIFNQLILTLYRVVTPDLYSKALPQIIEALYKNYLIHYEYESDGD
jgi:Txe/YoeB family toxin of Txe-Axe toxin-antitoxin module